MNRLNPMNHIRANLNHLILAAVLGASFVAATAKAQTTIPPNPATITDPVTWSAGAGAVTINDTGTLTIVPSVQNMNPAGDPNAGYGIANAFNFAGATVNLRFGDNDTFFNFNGPLTATASGDQTLKIDTAGYGGGGDRLAINFHTAIPNGGGALGLQVTYHMNGGGGVGGTSYVNLIASNTFTGPIALASMGGQYGCLVIGGERYRRAFDGNSPYNFPGSGSLAGGNYAGAIALAANTLLDYDSSAGQTLSGAISGAGELLQEGSGTLTLSGPNTYSGNTTVNSGRTLVLDNAGSLHFVVTNASANKVTGTGTATLNGAFTIDTSAVTTSLGYWTLVDVANKSYGGGFGVSGFNYAGGGVWTRTVGSSLWTFNQGTGALSLSGSALMVSYTISGQAGVIDALAKTISVIVPYGSDVTTLVPTYTVTSGSGFPASGSTRDFTSPVTFTVTDGSVVNTYIVTVTVAPFSPWINVNFDSTAQTGLAGPGGGFESNWNQTASTSGSALLDSTGAATSVGFTSSGNAGWGILGPWGSPALTMLRNGLANFGTGAGNAQQLVINGLSANKKFDVYIASANCIPTNQRSYGVWNTSNTTTTPGDHVCDDRANQNGSTWVEGNNYVLFSNVVPDSSGNITFNGYSIPDAPTYDVRFPVSGFQIVDKGAAGSGYDAWAANYAGGGTAGEDYNHDGVQNGVAYFMGMNGLATLPGVVDGKVIWPRVNVVASFEVQVSDNLADWVPATTGVDTSDPAKVVFTLPTGAARKFCRLVVTP